MDKLKNDLLEITSGIFLPCTEQSGISIDIHRGYSAVVPIPPSHSAVERIHSIEMVLTVIFFMICQYFKWTVLFTKHLRIAGLSIDPCKDVIADMLPEKSRILESGMSHRIRMDI